MATDDIKEMLVEHGHAETVKDLTRLSKKKMGPDRTEVRTFRNTKTDETWWVFGDANDEAVHPAGDHLYCLSMIDDELTAAFNPVSYWKSDHCLWDQHCGHYITTMYDLPDWIVLDELCENQFLVDIPDDKTQEEVKVAFETAGLLFDQSFHDFLIKWK